MTQTPGVAHLPINQEARRFLVLANVDPDPDIPAVFELMLWGLDHGLRFKGQHRTGDVRHAVETLAYLAQPTVAMTYLTDNPHDPGATLIDEQDLQQAMTPKEAAFRLLEALDIRLCADENSDGDYFPGIPQGDEP